jgi:hypothetical protein
MSAKEATTIPAAEKTEHMGFARRLSKKLSLGHGSSEGTSQGGKASEILDRSSSIRDEVNNGNFSGAKDIITKGQTSKESTSQADAGGASSGATGVNNEGLNKENVQRSANQTGKESAGGASGSGAGSRANTEYLNKDNTQQAAAPLSQGGIAQDNTGKPSAGDTTVEQRDMGSEKREAEPPQQQTSNEKEDTDSQNRDRKGSVAAGMLEPNYDIRKGPITVPGTFQAKNYHNSTGRETIVERGISSKAVSDQAKADDANASKPSTGKQSSPQVVFAGTGSASQPGNAGAGEGFSDEYIENELHDQENISSDVFDDGNPSQSLSKEAAGQDTSGKYHIDKEHLEKQGSMPTEKEGAAEAAAAAAAVGGGHGLSKGASGSKLSTARAQDHASTSPKSKAASTTEGYATGQGLASSNQTNRPGRTYARAVSGENIASNTPTSTGYSTAGGLNQTSGLRSTTTSQTNTALYNPSSTGFDEANVAGGGIRGLQQEGSHGISGTSTTGAKQASNTGGGSRQEDTSGVSSSAGTKRVVRPLSGSGYKLTVLQDKVQGVSQKCKTQLGVSASQISKRSPTVDAFFDAVAAERLRWMPRDGSRLDCSLRWASRLAYAVDALRASVGVFAPAANEAAMLIWGFCILLLEVSLRIRGISQIVANLLHSLIWTTRMCLKVSLADMAESPLASTCFCSMRLRTKSHLSSNLRLPQCLQTC